LNLGFERENTMKQHDRYMQKADNGQAFRDAIIAAGEAERGKKRRSAGSPQGAAAPVAQTVQVPAERRSALLGGPAPSRSSSMGPEKKKQRGSGSLLMM
jgi:hypothetical protein